MSSPNSDPAGRLLINDDLTVGGYANIFAIGDMTSLKGYPGQSPVAMQEGRAESPVLQHHLAATPAPLRERAIDAGIPIVRTYAPLVAGAAKMRYPIFLTYNIVGAIAWGAGVTLLGYFLGQIEFIRDNIDYIFLFIVFISVLPIITLAGMVPGWYCTE